MQIQPLFFDYYRLTVLQFLIQFLFLDFHNVPKAIVEILAMWTRAKRRIVQFTAWMNAPQWLSCIQVRMAL